MAVLDPDEYLDIGYPKHSSLKQFADATTSAHCRGKVLDAIYLFTDNTLKHLFSLVYNHLAAMPFFWTLSVCECDEPSPVGFYARYHSPFTLPLCEWSRVSCSCAPS